MKKLNGYWQWIGDHEWRMKSPGWISFIARGEGGYTLTMARDVGSIRDAHKLADIVIDASEDM